MDITRQTIRIYINQAKASFVNGNGVQTSESPAFFLGNEALLLCQLFSSTGEPQIIPTNAEWYASLDTTYGPDHDDLVQVTNDLFNLDADWNELDLASGKFCFQLTTNTPALVAAMGTKPRLDIHIEIHFRLPGEKWTILLHETVVIRNTTASFEPVASGSITYATIADLVAKQDRPTRVANYAALPTHPDDLDNCYVTSVSSAIQFDAADGCWYYAGTSIEFSSTD